MEKEFDELKEFLGDFFSYKKNKITIEMSLDDLGMYGDDKRDFLQSFLQRFNIESSNLDYDKFCELETFNPIKNLFFSKKDDKIIKISINHLVNVIKSKKWHNPNSIND
ncbi:MAG: DUF1493 family protein [Flavobacteriales bacterium]|nr:DUF1493 family protein [Flavobacteriales bacterium]